MVDESRQLRFAIFAAKDDLHAMATQGELRQRGHVCDVVFTNNLIADGGLECTLGQDGPARLCSNEGSWFEIRSLDAIWWRRANYPQLAHSHVAEGPELELATNEWNSALRGAVYSEFDGAWINHPEATQLADVKILQLRAALQVGLSTPSTYIGQDPESLRSFCDRHHLNELVIKKVRGTIKVPLLSVKISVEELQDGESIRLCPAIYQAEIPGTTHLRLHCFGERVLAVAIESEALDWRPDLHVPMALHDLPREIEDKLLALNRALNLRMSIMDAKLTPEGAFVWIETNPQGQFLFIQGLADVDLLVAFCDFLVDEALSVRRHA